MKILIVLSSVSFFGILLLHLIGYTIWGNHQPYPDETLLVLVVLNIVPFFTMLYQARASALGELWCNLTEDMPSMYTTIIIIVLAYTVCIGVMYYGRGQDISHIMNPELYDRAYEIRRNTGFLLVPGVISMLYYWAQMQFQD